jgi:CSLREA domain-containing protein
MRRKRFWIMAPVLALVLALMPPARLAQADTHTVNSTDDVNDGTCDLAHCSLREAIIAANNNPGDDTIAFNITSGCGGGGVCTIQPTIALPFLTDNDTTIDGYSQPGTAEATDGTPATLLIEISGASVSDNSGFNIISAGNVISGVVINRFGWSGIAIWGSTATDNIISGNYVGTDASGTADLGNTLDGVFIGLGAQNNTVGGNTPAARNVISGNDWDGVAIHNLNTMTNTVSGNFIGTNISGTAVLSNTLDGVYIYGGAKNNTVGGNTDGERNVISGNGRDGVRIYGSETMTNTVSGNYIGADVSGTAVLSNTLDGVRIEAGARDNIVGGDTDGERNVISGNGEDGVYIAGSGTTGNTVSRNYIGLAANGTDDLGNSRFGVIIDDGAQNNTVGGDTEDRRNVISGNDDSGVIIFDSDTMSNTISGNYIGTDANGTGDRGNGFGVRIWGAQNNTVGGDTDGERNIISGNDQHGVRIYGSDATGNTISGNYIGLAANGTDALGNDQQGVEIYGGPQNNTIGGNTDGERNVISGNGGYGVYISQSGTTGNTVSGNYIGVAANGTTDRGNSGYGVYIANGAQNNTVGGDTEDERNVISANYGGVRIGDSGTMSNTVSGNYIGLAANGTTDLGNADRGVYIVSDAQNNTVGPGNVIAYSGYEGVEVNGGSTTGNVITQNSIFANGLMGIDLTAGANGGIAAPVIVTTTEGSVNVVGTACADCTVEVFENDDTDGEGETYIGDTTATTSGAFTVTVSSLSKPYLTATATDATDGTSEFSAVFTATVSVGRKVYLPIILKNH